MKGVTKGYQYKMRAVYAHFPINCVISNDNSTVEVHNFLGEKYIRKVDVHEGVTVTSSAMKDELIIEGKQPGSRLSICCPYPTVYHRKEQGVKDIRILGRCLFLENHCCS
ncbi:unnamed protein product [Meganyctiphanes norvegica]|uniref:60S ribosomal protein L9 n=1 Tax=Meganyctiphanes norvegica TaxID=48144 RepID=A0AAV2SJW8_MEGNR